MPCEFAFGYPLVIYPFSLRAGITFVFVSFCVLRTLLGLLPGWGMQILVCEVSSTVRLRPQKYDQTEMWVVFHLQLGFYWLSLALRGILLVFLSFFLFSIIFGRGCGFREGSVFCTLFGDAFCFHEVVRYYQEYLLFVPIKTWQVIQQIFLKF